MYKKYIVKWIVLCQPIWSKILSAETIFENKTEAVKFNEHNMK